MVLYVIIVIDNGAGWVLNSCGKATAGAAPSVTELLVVKKRMRCRYC